MIYVRMRRRYSVLAARSNPADDDMVRFDASEIALDMLYTARMSVVNESGSDPTHYLVGWKTFFELSVMVTQSSLEQILGSPMIADTAREHYFAAVAPLEWQVGRELPPRSVWTYEPGRGWVYE